MKKTLIAVAALAATGAFAQVTISGAMDVGVEGIDKAATQLQTSRSGTTNVTFAGTEDLGGGMKAKFSVSTAFDSSFDNNTGIATPNKGSNTATATSAKPNTIGDNGMFVGIEGGFGSVIAGRPMNTLYGFSQTANGTKGVSGFAATDSITSGGVYVANAVQYLSPSLSGFQVQLEYNFDESNANNKNGSAIGLKYAQGPLAVTYVHNDQKAVTAAGTPVAPATPFGDGYSAKIDQLAASYDFTMAKLFLTYQTDAAPVKSTTAYVLGVTVPVGAAGTVWLQLGSWDSGVSGAPTKDITGLGYKHALSKRTQLYVNYGSRNDAAAGTAGTSGYGLGMLHTF